MNDDERAALAEELAAALIAKNDEVFATDFYDNITEDDDGAALLIREIVPVIMPIIDRLLADRAVPTPVDDDCQHDDCGVQTCHCVDQRIIQKMDAERVEAAAKAMFEFDRTCMKASVEWDDLPGTLARNGVSGRQHYRAMARAALAVAALPIVPDPRRIDTGYDLPNGERILEGDVLECDCEGRQLVTWEPLMSSWIVRGVGEFTYFDDDGNEKTHPFEQVTELKEYISWHGPVTHTTFTRAGSVYDNPDLIDSLEVPRKHAAGDAPMGLDDNSVVPWEAGLAVNPTTDNEYKATFIWYTEDRGRYREHVAIGTGSSRDAAIADAVAKAVAAKENSDERS